MTLARSLILAAGMALGAAGGIVPRVAGAQQLAVRFEIASVGDSTFTFAIGPHGWVANRRIGIVVDPTRRDAQVARFRILGVSEGTVTALVTGQTTLVTTQHVVVMPPPPPPAWQKRRDVWLGMAAGGVLGLLLGGALF